MNPAIQSILKSEGLPSPPGVASKLLELFSVPNVEVEDMADIIGADPALAARLMEYCNSPTFARSRETTSLKQAIVLIGMKAVKILALSFSLVRTVSDKGNAFDYDQFWNHSLAVASSAKAIAIACGEKGDEEFLLGLMLKSGQIGLAHTFPNRYEELLAESQQTGTSLFDLEIREWEVDQFEVSAGLLDHWNFPTHMVKTVVSFTQELEDVDSDVQTTVKILRLAERSARMLYQNYVHEQEITQVKEMANEWFQVGEDDFPALFDRATESWVEYAKILSFGTSDAQSFEQLERRALKGIAQLSMGLHEENAAVHQQNAELRMTAIIDRLTGLKNRRAYDDEVEKEWQRARRLGRPFVLAMIDIDHFKSVNDTYGHGVGDVALVEVAKTLKDNGREYDLCYRFGGEEFVLVLPECAPLDSLAAIERIRQAIEDLEIPIPDGVLRITASFGVAIQQSASEGTDSLSNLLVKADKLLYQAKSEGRNRVCNDHHASPSAPILPHGQTGQSTPSSSPAPN